MGSFKQYIQETNTLSPQEEEFLRRSIDRGLISDNYIKYDLVPPEVLVTLHNKRLIKISHGYGLVKLLGAAAQFVTGDMLTKAGMSDVKLMKGRR